MSKVRGRPSVPRERRRLSDLLTSNFRSTVQYGTFKGYQIPLSSHWGALARPAMLLGLYEKEVLETLCELSKNKDIFIDVGAADGFFAVGAVYAKLFNKSYAYEINENGRAVIGESARINGVKDKIEINGLFNVAAIEANLKEDIKNSVLLIDIEGDEFSLLNKEMLSKLSGASIIIEIHDFLFDTGDALFENLKSLLLQENFIIKTIESGPRDIPRSEFLDSLSDNERWLLCSEGREKRMRWLLAVPNES